MELRSRGNFRIRSWIARFLTFVGASVVFFMVIGLLFSLFFRGSSSHYKSGNVGLVKIEGMIEDSAATIKTLIELRENKSVKAILLRINSPGGPIAPAQEIYDEVKKTVKLKPVVVSMGSLAASGGYYVAAPASKIVANPGTITGSIGVIMQHFVVEALIRKMNLRWETIKAGEVKDMGTPLRDFTYKERQILTNLSKEMHEQFIRHVSEGRNIPIDEVRAMATGTIFSGEQAIKNKLVDELGGQERALEVAGRLANLKDKPKLFEATPKKQWPDYFFEKLLGTEMQNRLTKIIINSLPSYIVPMAISQ